MPWRQPGWLDEANAWIQDTLAEKGIRLTGPIEQYHRTPWSTVLRVATPGGHVYFKAPAPVLIHEAAITQALSHWRPDCILPPIAFQLERGWMLLPDGGTRLRELIKVAGESRPWKTVLPAYASLQMDMVSHRDEMQALGVPDRRLAKLPSLFERLLANEQALRVSYPDGLTKVEVERLRELVPVLSATCQELARFEIPESLDHQDLNDGNVFVNDDHAVFFDWSEASITHPFFSVRTVVVSLEMTLGLEEGSVPVPLIRDAYLEPWTKHFAPENLLKAFELAQRLWMIPGALAWHRILSSLDGGDREAFLAKHTS
jgi:hypothetical protein